MVQIHAGAVFFSLLLIFSGLIGNAALAAELVYEFFLL